MKKRKDTEGMSASERREISAKDDTKAEAKVARERTAKLREQRLTKDLAQADQDVSGGERQVIDQMLRIDELRNGGFDTKEAELLLQSLEQHLADWQARRDEIVRQLKILAGRW
jgi:hypothetical protein